MLDENMLNKKFKNLINHEKYNFFFQVEHNLVLKEGRSIDKNNFIFGNIKSIYNNDNYLVRIINLEDDFKYYLDDKYLILRKEPPMKAILGDTQTDDQMWIYNSYYNFAFNHESPGHARLYESEKWEDGINHFVNNNFEKFKERYQKRIDNFRYYIKNASHINFLILRYNDYPLKLENIIKKIYPDLSFNIYVYTGLEEFINLTLKKNEEGTKEFDVEYLKYLNISEEENPEEYERYKKEKIIFSDSEIVKFKYIWF